MRCPFCSHENSQVKDSRPSEDGASIRRRRQCEDCGARFTTFERVQLRDLNVVKSANRREPFDRSKLERSIAIACRKRPVPQERIEKLASSIQRQVETSGESEIESSRIGGMIAEVVEGLRKNGEEGDGQIEASVRRRVEAPCARFPIYQDL